MHEARWASDAHSPDAGVYENHGERVVRGRRQRGRTLTRAHARSGDRIAVASYLGTSDSFDRTIAAFAAAYADQNERDSQAFADAVASGRLAAADTV
jgi:hypothetical protein